MRALVLIIALFGLFAIPVLHAESLVIISPHWEGMRYEFERAFANWRSEKGLNPVQIVWRDVGGTSEIVRFVQSEFQASSKIESEKPQGIGVDIIFGGGVDPFVTFKKLGLLSKLDIDPAVLSNLAFDVSGQPIYDQEHFWFAPTLSAFGIFCNQKVLNILAIKAPRSWEDLWGPEFNSWITSADPRRSGSSHMFYEIILQAYGWQRGWQYIFALANNYRTFLSNSPQAILDVVNGEVACSFAIDSQAKAQLNQFTEGSFVFNVPSKASLYNGDGIAVLRGAPNFEAAKNFVEFTLSEPAQKLLYQKKGSLGGPQQYELDRLPVWPKLFEDEKISALNPFKNDNADSLHFNSKLSAERWEAINDLLSVFVVEAKDFGRISQKKCQAIIPEQAVIDELLKNKIWENQIERNKIISKWRSDAAQCSIQSSLTIKALPCLIVLAMALLLLIRRRFF